MIFNLMRALYMREIFHIKCDFDSLGMDENSLKSALKLCKYFETEDVFEHANLEVFFKVLEEMKKIADLGYFRLNHMLISTAFLLSLDEFKNNFEVVGAIVKMVENNRKMIMDLDGSSTYFIVSAIFRFIELAKRDGNNYDEQRVENLYKFALKIIPKLSDKDKKDVCKDIPKIDRDKALECFGLILE